MDMEKNNLNLELKVENNPFSKMDERTLRVERLKVEERISIIQEQKSQIREDNPASFEEFKKLN